MADDYTIVRQLHVNDVDADTGNVVPGVQVTVRDLVTGTVMPVFVPDRLYDGPNARVLIEDRLAKVRDVHALGAPPPSAPAA